ELYWANPDPRGGSEQAGRRRVLVVSSDDAREAIANGGTTMTVTTRDRGWASQVRMGGDASGRAEPSWAWWEQGRTVRSPRIAARMCTVDAATLDSVSRVLRYLLNL